jgi:hypothetical protein
MAKQQRTTEAEPKTEIAFTCDTCDTTITPVPIARITEQHAAHRKARMVVRFQPDTEALSAAVTAHRRRHSCPSPHLTATTD